MRPTKAQFRAWGKQGGKARDAKLTAKRKREIATKAGKASGAKRNGRG